MDVLSVQNKAGLYPLEGKGFLASPDAQNLCHGTIHKCTCTEIFCTFRMGTVVRVSGFPQYPYRFGFNISK